MRETIAAERELAGMQREFAPEFASGFIAEPPAKLRALHQYFAALLGQSPLPPVRCNAPRFSAVIETDGTLKPCFFLPAWGALGERELPKLGLAGTMRRVGFQSHDGRIFDALTKKGGVLVAIKTEPRAADALAILFSYGGGNAAIGAWTGRV